MKQESYKRGLVRNLRMVALYRVLVHSFGFPISTIVLFFEDHGLTMSEVFLLQAIFAVVMCVIEVPSGYVADCLGRRRTLIVGALTALLASVVYLCAYGFVGFLIGEILIGFAASMISGADEALVYDSMVELRLEARFGKFWGRINCIELSGSAAIMLAGGFIGAYNHRLPFAFTLAGFILMSWCAFRFVEPQRKRIAVQHGHFRELRRIAYECLVRRPQLRWLILSGALLHMLNQAGFWLYQPLFELRELPEQYFGIVYAGLALGASLIASRIHWLEERVELYKSIGLACLAGMLGYFLIAYVEAYWGFCFLLALQFVRIVCRVSLSHELNKLVESEFRATAVSIKNFAQGVCFSVLAIVLGPVVDINGPVYTCCLLGVGMLLAGLFLLSIRPKA